jgi:hypothetical protein
MTSHGLYCHLPIIQPTSSTNPDIAIAILACKWQSRCYVGLVLERVSGDAALPVYAIEPRNTEWVNSRGDSSPRDRSDPLPGSIFFAPDMRAHRRGWEEHIAIRQVTSAFWRDLRERSPTLEWMDVYIKYRHDQIPESLIPYIELRMPSWVYNNLRLLGFTLDTREGEHSRLIPRLWCHSFTRQLSHGEGAEGGHTEQFEIWLCQADPLRRRNGEMPIAAYARILTSGEDPGLPQEEDFSNIATWDGFSRAFGDAERTVQLSCIPPMETGSQNVTYELAIELYGNIYSSLDHRHNKDL